MLTIYKLSLTQMLRPKRLLILLFIASVPIALSVVAAIFPPDTEDMVSFRDDFLMGPMVISAVLPIVTVVLGTASLGHEIEDQTMTYLFLKPVPRWGIILPKFLATITVAGIVVIGSGVLTTAIVPEGSVTTSVAAAVGLAVGVLAYTSIFYVGRTHDEPRAGGRTRLRVRMGSGDSRLLAGRPMSQHPPLH